MQWRRMPGPREDRGRLSSLWTGARGSSGDARRRNAVGAHGWQRGRSPVMPPSGKHHSDPSSSIRRAMGPDRPPIRSAAWRRRARSEKSAEVTTVHRLQPRQAIRKIGARCKGRFGLSCRYRSTLRTAMIDGPVSGLGDLCIAGQGTRVTRRGVNMHPTGKVDHEPEPFAFLAPRGSGPIPATGPRDPSGRQAGCLAAGPCRSHGSRRSMPRYRRSPRWRRLRFRPRS